MMTNEKKMKKREKIKNEKKLEKLKKKTQTNEMLSTEKRWVPKT